MVEVETKPDSQQKMLKIRESASSYIAHNDGVKKAIPLIDDSAVPPERLAELIGGIYDIFKQVDIKPVAFWGHAGDGILKMQPHLNLSQVGDRQKAFRLLDEYSKLVISLGGATSAASGDGRLKAPYLEYLYGPEVYAILGKVKNIFDPYSTLNPGVKFGTTIEDIKRQLRPDYTFGRSVRTSSKKLSWCAREELNLHTLTGTCPSDKSVYHSATRA